MARLIIRTGWADRCNTFRVGTRTSRKPPPDFCGDRSAKGKPVETLRIVKISRLGVAISPLGGHIIVEIIRPYGAT
jgi:hypothetical protein